MLTARTSRLLQNFLRSSLAHRNYTVLVHALNISTNNEPAVIIGGVAPFSTVDWPGKLTATIFLQGCPWRCGYCHNVDMQPKETHNAPYELADVLAFVDARAGLLDGIVLSGGEPLMQEGVIDLAAALSQRGMALGLHTGGYRPALLAALLKKVEWVGFDYKTLFAQYDDIVGGHNAASGSAARQSLEILMQSGRAFEVRTTVDATHFSLEMLSACEDELRHMGIDTWVLQVCHNATKEGALVGSAPSLARIESYLSQNPHTIARLRNA